MQNPDSSDIYSALANRYIDAAEEPFLDFCLSSNYSFISHLLVTEYASMPSLIVASRKALKNASSKDMVTIRNAAERSASYIDSLIKRNEQTWLERAESEKDLRMEV